MLAIQSETELYQPVKSYFIEKGYEVRGEVNHCDLVAIKDNEEPVIVELKKTFNLPLLIQGIERLKHSSQVYVAVELPKSGKAPHGLKWGELRRLSSMLGLGLITVRFYTTRKPAVEIICHPHAYVPTPRRKQSARLLNEFHERSGDYNVGGSNQRKLITAYREKVLQCAYMLQQHGPLSPKQLKELTHIPQVGLILQKNYYQWFTKVNRGIYKINPEGEQALKQYESIIAAYPTINKTSPRSSKR